MAAGRKAPDYKVADSQLASIISALETLGSDTHISNTLELEHLHHWKIITLYLKPRNQVIIMVACKGENNAAAQAEYHDLYENLEIKGKKIKPMDITGIDLKEVIDVMLRNIQLLYKSAQHYALQGKNLFSNECDFIRALYSIFRIPLPASLSPTEFEKDYHIDGLWKKVSETWERTSYQSFSREIKVAPPPPSSSLLLQGFFAMSTDVPEKKEPYYVRCSPVDSHWDIARLHDPDNNRTQICLVARTEPVTIAARQELLKILESKKDLLIVKQTKPLENVLHDFCTNPITVSLAR